MLRTLPRWAQWVETRAANLGGICVLSSSPALVWSHGLGGCCESDEIRGIGSILDPAKLGRTVLRLDLRGHGRSKSAHEPCDGDHSQYLWSELAKDLRRAAADSVSRSFFGGEGLGAAVALEAAIAAQASGSIDAPPGLVLMRPPQMLADVAKGSADPVLREEIHRVAVLVETGGFDALELEEMDKAPFLDGAAAIFNNEKGELKGKLQQLRRAIDKEIFAAALRGYAASEQPGKQLAARFKEGLAKSSPTMAADAYGVPLSTGCPVLVLAVAADEQHPVKAAEELAEMLPDSELEVADTLESLVGKHARSTWTARINTFLRKAWMKEFLSKRVMPQ